MRRIFSLLAVLLLLALPAQAGTNSGPVALVTAQVIPEGTVPVTVTNPGAQSAYLKIVTSAEVGTATLTVTVFAEGVATCTLTGITTNTTTMALLGSTVAAAGSVADVCDFPLSQNTSFTFAVTGTSTPTFTVTATLHYVGASY